MFAFIKMEAKGQATETHDAAKYAHEQLLPFYQKTNILMKDENYCLIYLKRLYTNGKEM